LFEFDRDTGHPSEIKEKVLYDLAGLGYTVPSTGKPVRRVMVVRKGESSGVMFFRTLEECQTMAKVYQDDADSEQQELRNYR